MIISRTPFRVSFVGGGTDLENFCEREPGAVLSSTINKYIYVTVKRQVAIASHKFRISWNKLEFTDSVDDIEHPIIREALKMLKIDFPLEITTFADVPSQTGLGSSSAFAVGLLNALYALQGIRRTKYQLASQAAEIEIRKLDRKIGCQDHFAAAYGGFNVFKFYPNLQVEVFPVYRKKSIVNEIQNNLLMFYTAVQRDAGKILETQSEVTKSSDEKFELLKNMRDLVTPLEGVMRGELEPDYFGKLLHKNWLFKRELTSKISSSAINDYYERAMKAGALGGKLCGAGGGGFLLIYVKPDKRSAVLNELSELYCMPAEFENSGTRITYYDHSNLEEEDPKSVIVDYKNQ